MSPTKAREKSGSVSRPEGAKSEEPPPRDIAGARPKLHGDLPFALGEGRRERVLDGEESARLVVVEVHRGDAGAVNEDVELPRRVLIATTGELPVSRPTHPAQRPLNDHGALGW